MTRVKICGVTRIDDAAAIATVGADFIGLNFWPRSKRHVTAAQAAPIAAAIRAAGSSKITGVFVDATPAEIAAVFAHVHLDVVQLHGNESPADVAEVARLLGIPVWKALAAGPALDVGFPADAILLDTPSPARGGTGVAFDWAIAAEARRAHPGLRFVLAGGLTADTVAAAIAQVQPWGVDVASGVESAPGVKDRVLVERFIAAVRAG